MQIGWFCTRPIARQGSVADDGEAFPEGAGDEAPEENQNAVSPVDGDDAAFAAQPPENEPGGAGRGNQHRIPLVIGKKGGGDKARADV